MFEVRKVRGLNFDSERTELFGSFFKVSEVLCSDLEHEPMIRLVRGSKFQSSKSLRFDVRCEHFFDTDSNVDILDIL